MKSASHSIPDWLRGAIYQIYIRSFKDSNGDGIGDLNGVTESLDYLDWLGITTLWLSPIHPSPMLDSGYDVSDFNEVHPDFGTLADLDHLISQCHRRGLRVILDFVGNHTSDRHAWFAESSSSRINPRRDWYYWHDPAHDDGPPNNWLNEYGQSAWTWHGPTAQYYYHSFLTEQPDLNWRNPAVRSAMKKVMCFWLDQGVDGFRVDALPWMLKDELLRSNPPNPTFSKQDPARQVYPAFTQDQLGIEKLINELRVIVDRYEDRVLLGEVRLSLDRLPAYYEAGLHFPFNYQLAGQKMSPFELRKMIDSTEARLGEQMWPNWLLGTHDESRAVSRYGTQAARLMAMLIFTLRGTPGIYYGEELGLRDTPLQPAVLQDTYARLLPGLGRGRDPQRTPMPWNETIHAGFSKHTPWLPIDEAYQTCNVQKQREQSDSWLNYYRRLLALRHSQAIQEGVYSPGEITPQGFSFQRIHESYTYQVCLNFSDEPLEFQLLKPEAVNVLDTHNPVQSLVSRVVALLPWQGKVLQFPTSSNAQITQKSSIELTNKNAFQTLG